MTKKIIFFITYFSIVVCSIFAEKIKCDFTDEIIICLIDNDDEIEREINYYDIGHKYNYFLNIADNFFEFLRELILTDLKFDDKIFSEKHSNLITNIPAELNTIFLEYPELKNKGYEYYINFTIFLCIIVYENIDNRNLIIPELQIEEINIDNIMKIKSMFDKQDIDIVYDNEDRIIQFLKDNII